MTTRAPAATMFSSAVTCPALSPSCLPAPVRSRAPARAAAASAPWRIITKNGLDAGLRDEAEHRLRLLRGGRRRDGRADGAQRGRRGQPPPRPPHAQACGAHCFSPLA
jgi:hypothetical protein